MGVAMFKQRRVNFPQISIEQTLITLGYFCLARLSLLFVFAKTNASPFWPPAGLAFLTLIIFGGRATWGVLVGAAAANFITFIENGNTPWPLALGLSIILGAGNSTSALLGWIIAGKPKSSLGFVFDTTFVVRLVLGAATAAVLAAVVGSSTVVLGGTAPRALWWAILRVWAFGDGIGILVLLPAMLSWWCYSEGQKRWDLWPPLCVLAIAVAQHWVLGGAFWFLTIMLSAPPLILLLGSRRGCWNTVFLTTIILTWQTSHGIGFFAERDEVQSFLNLQICLSGVIGVLFFDAWLKKTKLSESQAIGVRVLLDKDPTLSSISLIPAFAITAIGTIITLLAWHSLRENENIRFNDRTEETAKRAANEFGLRVEELLRALERLASTWSLNVQVVSKSVWHKEAYAYCRDYDCIQALEWIDRERIVQWVEPLRGNEAIVGLRLNDDPVRRATLDSALKDQQTKTTSVIQLKQGGAGFIAYMPVYTANGQNDGFLVAVLRLSEFIEHLRRKSGVWDANSYGLDILQGDKTVFSQGTTLPRSSPLVPSSKITILRDPLELRLHPLLSTIQAYSTPLPVLVLNAGLLLSTLLGTSVIFINITLKYAHRSREDSQTKARFLATMSHEIRTPMNGILGAVELALSSPIDPEVRGYLDTVEYSGRILLTIINDILDFSKIESGRMTLESIGHFEKLNPSPSTDWHLTCYVIAYESVPVWFF